MKVYPELYLSEIIRGYVVLVWTKNLGLQQ